MAHKILFIIAVIWIFASAGYSLVAKWSGIKFITELVIKLVSISTIVWAVLELLKVQY